MKQIVKQAIKKYYYDKDIESYRAHCKAAFRFPEEIISYCDQKKISANKAGITDIKESLYYSFEIRIFNKLEFQVCYESFLSVSKLAPVFFIRHEYHITSYPGEELFDHMLGGYAQKSFCTDQQKLDSLIKESFISRGYTYLTTEDLEEVIEDLKMPEGIRLFGPQVDVDYALFKGLWDLEETD